MFKHKYNDIVKVKDDIHVWHVWYIVHEYLECGLDIS